MDKQMAWLLLASQFLVGSLVCSAIANPKRWGTINQLGLLLVGLFALLIAAFS